MAPKRPKILKNLKFVTCQRLCESAHVFCYSQWVPSFDISSQSKTESLNNASFLSLTTRTPCIDHSTFLSGIYTLFYTYKHSHLSKSILTSQMTQGTCRRYMEEIMLISVINYHLASSIPNAATKHSNQ